MLKADYSRITLTVTDTFDEDTYLKNEYIINYTDSQITVDYSVEKFNELSLDNPVTQVKTVYEGQAVIVDGVLVSVDDEEVELTADIAKVGLTFKKQYFKNVEFTDLSLKAEVSDAKSFLDAELNCTDMKVEAVFLQSFYSILITYNSSIGSKVEYKYSFKR